MSDLEGIPVATPSGGTFYVLTQDEADYFTDRATRYQDEHHLTLVSDLQDVDRLLIMETMAWRWGMWLLREQDYWGAPVDVDTLQKSLHDYSKELRMLKKQMGFDRLTRDKDKGESIPAYLDNLRARAKEFGIMREKQLTKAITLFQELQAYITLHDNCNEAERKQQDCELEDIITWLREVAFPEFNAIDEHFRENQQRFWVKTL